MKSVILKISLPFFLTCFSIGMNAQNYFGYRAGINLANVSKTEDGFITKERIPGITAHLLLDFTLADNLSLQPELGFLQKGYRKTITLFGEKRYATTIHYVDISASLKYRFGSKKLKGHVLAGPYAGLAISGKTKDLDDGSTNDVRIEEGGGINRPDLGLTFGAGVGIPIREGDLFLDARYLLGLVIMANDLDNGDLKNRGFNFSLGYIFRIGR